MDLLAEEERFKSQLRNKRLICEAEFDLSDIDLLRTTVLPLGTKAWEYPAACAVLTVGCGIYYYDAGNFWNAFDNLRTPAECSWWGERFETFLVLHDSLEAFSHLGGHRFVAPILAHGGIPQTCLPDFFAAITAHGDLDYSGQELLKQISSHPSWVATTDKPVRRFLEHGGEVAEDFVGRFLDLWRAYGEGDLNARSGLPERVVGAFSKWYERYRPRNRARHIRFPRPDLRLEPAGVGMFLHLPACTHFPGLSATDYWTALSGKWAITREHDLPCAPSAIYEVECRDHRFLIEGFDTEKPVLFFDPTTGRAIPDAKQRRLPSYVWAVAPSTAVFTPTAQYVEPLPRWPGYIVATLDLSNTVALDVFEEKFEVRRPFFSLGQSAAIANVLSKGGDAVYSAPPRIAWEGKANLSLAKQGKQLGNIDIEANELDVLLGGSGDLGDFDLTLRGPLGSTFRMHFLLAPGLTVTTEPKIAWPKCDRIEWWISAASGAIRTIDGSALPFVTRTTSCEFFLRDSDSELHLVAHVPQLSWRLAGDICSGEDGFQSRQTLISTNDLVKAKYPLLEVRSGQVTSLLAMELVPKHTRARTLYPRRRLTVPNNVWYFDLRTVRDDLLSSGLPEEYDLVVADQETNTPHRTSVLEVRPPWDLSGFRVTHARETDEYIFSAQWNEFGKTVAGRWLVVVPTWRRPAVPLATKELSDLDTCSCDLRVNAAAVLPGRYDIRAIHAPWGSDNWVEAVATARVYADVAPHRWNEVFAAGLHRSIADLCEAFLSYWHRPDLIAQSPVARSQLSANEVAAVIGALMAHASPTKNFALGSELRRLCVMRPYGLIAALKTYPQRAAAWREFFPPSEIILLDATESDKTFLRDLAFQYDVLTTAGRRIMRKYSYRRLSPPLRQWCDQLNRHKPPLYHVVWLCERFAVFDGQSRGMMREYAVLKEPLLVLPERAQ